ncbi:DUF2147 domain-containing protein [Bradyrhizobium sp. Bra64]|uniref:DUF2147 domain-containing protein n=1 Tax=Bradyrhizobium sp. Bra64 TaxID=2926009 RepID=UPI002118CB4B|nr:DUF2147 domain-containing protein [Bradyrhizobium sp. Bra64]
MRKLLATAAFLLASTAAQAQYTFEYGGRTIRIDPDRGTVSIPGVYDNTGQGKAKKAKNDPKADLKNDPKATPKADPQAPQQAKADPQPPANPAPAPAPLAAPPAAEQAPVQAPVAAAPSAPPAPPANTAKNAPAEDAMVPPPQPAPSAAPTVAAVPPAPPAPAVAAVPPAPPAPAPAPVQAAAVAPPAPATAPTRDLTSPLGVWLTEEKEGKVRIEQCGTNLCGYSVDSKSNQNGEQVLINMKPGKDQKDQKWSGRILDPNSGSTYDSTITLRGTDRLRVQGCAFGGMFCGGQTWTRVN